MLDGAMIVWGTHYRPSEFAARLAKAASSVSIGGTLRDRIGPVVTFGECLAVLCGFRVEVGRLPANFDPSWTRDRT